jgi:hypothetical protein
VTAGSSAAFGSVLANIRSRLPERHDSKTLHGRSSNRINGVQLSEGITGFGQVLIRFISSDACPLFAGTPVRIEATDKKLYPSLNISRVFNVVSGQFANLSFVDLLLMVRQHRYPILQVLFWHLAQRN